MIKNVLTIFLTIVMLFCFTVVAFASDDLEILPDGGYYIGDVDMDGNISIMDATEIQFHLARLTTMTNEKLKLADADLDGVVSVSDATRIQMHLAGILQIVQPTKPTSTQPSTEEDDKPIELPFVPAK